MVTHIAEHSYLNALIKHCSNFRLDGLPAAGEIFYQNIALEDIYAPLRLSASKETSEILKWKASIWDLVNDENSKKPSNEIDETTIAKIEDFFYTNDALEDTNESFSQLVSYIDAQMRRPITSEISELDLFIRQLDNQINKLSLERNIVVDDDFTTATTPSEIVVEIEKYTSKTITSLNTQDNKQINIEMEQLFREYDDKPVGPIIKDYPSRKIILSNPGCGKTMLSKRIALAYATKDTRKIENYCLPGEMFPLLLYCRTLNGSKLFEQNDLLSTAYDMIVNTFDGADIERDEFDAMVKTHAISGRLLLIIDGFDELFSKQNREYFAESLYNFLVANKNVHLLLTSRIATFANSDRSDDKVIEKINSIPFVRFNIIPALNQVEIDDFVLRWHDVLLPHNAQRLAIAESIISQLHLPTFEYLKKMTCVPFHLSNILLVARTSNRIPNNKVQLYKDYLTIALNWNATGNIKTNEMEILLAYIAYHMMKKGIQRISKKMLIDLLLKCYHDLEDEFVEPMDENNVVDFIAELEERTCVLKRSFTILDQDIYQFTHLNLQEYLSAYAITKGCSEDLKSSIEVVAEHYRKSRWREVVILSTLLSVNRTQRNSIVDFLINEAENSEDNYHANNLLFEFIANGVPITSMRKHAIYDLVFKENITDFQIKKICDFMQDSSSTEFKTYVTYKFEESLKLGDSKYSYVIATIRAFEFLQEDKQPLDEARRLVLNFDDNNLVVGLHIFAVLGWCKYCKLNNEFALSDIVLLPDFRIRIRNLILSSEKYFFDVAIALKDIILAEYLLDLSFLDSTVYRRIIELLQTENSVNAAERILSMFPINYRTLAFHSQGNIEVLKAKYLEKYREHFSDEKHAKDLVFDFSICTLLGCWNVSSDELLHEFTDLEGYYGKNSKHADDASKIKLKQLQREIYSLTDPISAGFNYYEDQDFEGAKAAFIIAYEKGNTTVCNNLAYMLRRKEVDNVTITDMSYTVDQLLAEGVSAKMPFSIINYGLHIAQMGDTLDYEKGLAIVKTLEIPPPNQFKEVYSWWLNIAEQGELEGLIVLAWLMELGIISNTPFGTLEQVMNLIQQQS